MWNGSIYFIVQIKTNKADLVFLDKPNGLIYIIDFAFLMTAMQLTWFRRSMVNMPTSLAWRYQHPYYYWCVGLSVFLSCSPWEYPDTPLITVGVGDSHLMWWYGLKNYMDVSFCITAIYLLFDANCNKSCLVYSMFLLIVYHRLKDDDIIFIET